MVFQMKINNGIWLVFIIASSLCLNIYGIQWGVPDEARINLVFSDKSVVKQLSSEMENLRDEIYEATDYYGHLRNYQDREISVIIDGAAITITRSQLDAMRSYLLRSYNADEQAVLIALGRMEPSKFNFNPHFFQYGGIYLYLVGACLKLASILDVVTLNQSLEYYFLHPAELGKLFTVGRLVGAIAGALIVFLLYLLGNSLLGRRAGLLAASLLTVTPVVVIFNHHLRPYIFCLWPVILAFYFSSKILNSNQIKPYLLAGSLSGIATGILVLCGFVIVAIPIAHLLRELYNGKTTKEVIISLNSKKIYLSLLLFLLGFLICNPYILFSLREFWNEMITASQHFKTVFTPNSWLNYYAHIMRSGFGFPLWLLITGGLLFSLYKRNRIDILILATILPFYLYISSTMRTHVHYLLPIVPLLVLMAARLLDAGLGVRKIKYVTFFSFLIILIYSFLYSASYDRIFVRKNVRTTAGEWITSNIKGGSTIGIPDLPSPFRTPPVNPLRYKLIITGWDRSLIETQKPDYVIIIELHWLGYKSYQEIMNILSNYKEVKRFDEPAGIFGLTFRRDLNAPLDWWYPNPVILVFKRL